MSETRLRPVTCVVVDDHPPLREAAAAALAAAGVDVLATADDRDTTLAVLAGVRPDALVLDLVLPGVKGVELVKEAVAAAPDTAVLIYTGSAEEGVLVDALRAGARGFVRKNAPLDELVQAVKAVAAGESWLDRRLAGAVLKAAVETPLPVLSQRERDILRFLAAGRSNNDIAAALHISPDTVRTYIRRAMVKLEAETRTQAVATALRLGLVD
jgi:DNA-binding NarL/FixJ family response regulator